MHPSDSNIRSAPFILSDERCEEIFKLTDGAASSCFQCGTCTTACPIGLAGEDGRSIRSMIRELQLGIENNDGSIWECTTCAQCEASCPRGVPIADLFRSLRSLCWATRQLPAGVPSILWSVYWNNNPWFQPPSNRSQWSDNSCIPRYDPEQHEILLFIGCTASYDQRAQRVARSLVRLLQAARVPFGTLGTDEPCCGDSVLSFGHRGYYEDLVHQAMDVFNTNGVSRIVTISPHSYDSFSRHFPRVEPQMGNLKVIHYSEYLADLIASGRLKLTNPLNRKLTYHDPCYLARHNDVIQAPRNVLTALAGTQFTEMSHHSGETICCGGGGGQMWMEADGSHRIAERRIAEAIATEADIIVTACPFCIACLEDSINGSRSTAIEVLDLAEVAEMALLLEA